MEPPDSDSLRNTSEGEERFRPIIRREGGPVTLATTRRHLETRRLYGAVMRMDNLTFANRGSVVFTGRMGESSQRTCKLLVAAWAEQRVDAT